MDNERFDEHLATYWQRTDAEFTYLWSVVEEYFSEMPFADRKKAFAMEEWEKNKRAIVTRLLKHQKLYTLRSDCAVLTYDRIEHTNAFVYLNWYDLFVQL